MSPWMRQLVIQGGALILVLSLIWPWVAVTGQKFNPRDIAMAVGAGAFILAILARQPWWWRMIQLGFAPLAWWVSQLHIPPLWFLAAFTVLFLVQRGAVSGQVPLYLTGDRTLDVLTRIVDERKVSRFVDLGAGVGSVVISLARRFPEVNFIGVENSPVPWFIGWLRSRGLKNVCWHWGSFWNISLANTDMTYAYLAPPPMPDLFKKVQSEMGPGSIFISNSFPVPGRSPSTRIEVPGSSNTLFCYFGRDQKT